MPKPYDVTTKELVTQFPLDMLHFAGLPAEAAEVLTSDLSTVPTEADYALRVQIDALLFYIAHFEFQSSYDASLGERVLRYNVLLRYLYRLAVQSVVFLLRPEADGPEMTGRIEYATGEDGSFTFRYRIVRVWQTPAAELLQGDLASVVFAPLSNVSANALPDVVEQMRQRIQQETNGEQTRLMLTCAYVLMGLKYPPDVTDSLFQGVIGMEESSTYQVIKARGRAEGLAEGRLQGRAEEARNLLLRMGRKRLGEPSPRTQATIAAIADPERLEQLAESLLDVESWSELLA